MIETHEHGGVQRVVSFSSDRVTLPAFVNDQAVRLTDYGRNYAHLALCRKRVQVELLEEVSTN
jgi:hypothetical protein